MRSPSANDRQVGGDHYKSSYQHWDWSLDVEANPMQYQITKYLRARKKGGLQDMEKLRHFIQKYKEIRQTDRDYPPSRIQTFMREVATVHWCKANDMDELETRIALDVIMSPEVDTLGSLDSIVLRMMELFKAAQDKASEASPEYIDQ